MARGEKQPQGDQSQHQWPIENINRYFGGTATESSDIAFGDGLHIFLGSDIPKRLELFPNAGVARFTSQDAQLTLYRSFPVLDQDGVIFESAAEGSKLTVTAAGEVTLSVAPAPTEPALQTAHVAPQSPSEAPIRRSPQFPTPEEKQRVTLAGRVGAQPSFRTSPKGQFIGQFPLAVHEGEATTWHTVVAFGDRAKTLQETLQKGQPVEVVGYLHTKERKTRDGGSKLVEEIYATVVKQHQPASR